MRNYLIYFILLCVLNCGDISVKAQYGYQDYIFQQFRVEIQRFQGESAADLLSADLRWYNAMVTALGRIFDPIVDLKDLWIRACRDFPMVKLNSVNSEKMQDLCGYTPVQLQKSLTTLTFVDEKSEAQHFERSGDVFYQRFLSQTENLALMYNRNKICVYPQLRKLLQIWRDYVNNLTTRKAKVTRGVSDAFQNSTKESASLTRIIREIITRIGSCGRTTHPNVCADSLLAEKIECTAPNSNCVAYTSLAYNLDEKITAEFKIALQKNVDEFQTMAYDFDVADRKWKAGLVEIQKCPNQN